MIVHKGKHEVWQGGGVTTQMATTAKTGGDGTLADEPVRLHYKKRVPLSSPKLQDNCGIKAEGTNRT